MTGKQTRDEPEKGKGAVLHAEANVNHLVRPVLKEKTNIVLKVKKNHEKPGDWALANPMSNSDEEDEVEVRGQVTRKLNKFIASAAPEMKFSQKMTSFKRRIAHEVAEEAGLWHQSEKKGKKRRLVVRKRVDAGTQGRRNDHAEGDEGLRDQAEVDGGRVDQAEVHGGRVDQAEVDGGRVDQAEVDGGRGGQTEAVAVKVKEEGGVNARCGIRKAVPGEEAVFVAGQRPGRGLLLLDEYDATMKKKDKEGRYRCTSYEAPPKGTSCPATAKTKDHNGTIIYVGNDGTGNTHQHGSMLTEVITNHIRHSTRQKAIATAGVKTRNLVTNIFKQTEEAANAQGVEFGQNVKEASLARYIRKAKAKQANYPKETKLPQEILKILETEAPHLKEAVSGEKWLRFSSSLRPDYNPENPEHAEDPIALIFMSEHAKERLTQATDWAGDGIYDIAMLPFKQLYSVHSVQKSGQVIPAVFALLPGQSTEWYEVMWTTVFETLDDWSGPEVFIQDQELAVTNSLLKMAKGDIKILYCWFHLRTNWFERYRDSGMQKLEKGNPAVHRYYRYCSALVFVPAPDVHELYTKVVRPILEELKDEEGNLPASVSDFSKYLEENYFGSPSKRSNKHLKARVDPAKWTHYATLLEDLAYTNNSVEGWHNGAQNELGMNANLWKFLTWLRAEETRQKSMWWEDMMGNPQVRKHDDGTGTARKQSSRRKYDKLQSLARNYETFVDKKSYLKAVWKAINANYDA